MNELMYNLVTWSDYAFHNSETIKNHLSETIFFFFLRFLKNPGKASLKAPFYYFGKKKMIFKNFFLDNYFI